MKQRLKIFDPAVIGLAVLATLVGLVVIFDAGYARSISKGLGAMNGEFRSQLMFLPVALIAGFISALIVPEVWKKLAVPGFILSLILLVAVKRFGHEMNGAQRWLGTGSIGIQPAEFAKLATVLYLARVFADRPKWPEKIQAPNDWVRRVDAVWIPKLRRCFPALMILMAVGLVELEPDLGTAAVIATIAFAMIYLGGANRKTLLYGVAICLLVGGIFVSKERYRIERILRHPARWTATNFGHYEYQTDQAEWAIADGGLMGVGFGNGHAKELLPATTTDFVMATVGEETGLIGALGILGLLAVITYRLFFLANLAHDRFRMLVLSGVGAWIGIQTCVNVMMSNAFLPAIGIPLPFISSGGSSLVAVWMGVGVCLSMLVPVPQKQEDKVEARSYRGRNRRPHLSGA